MKKVAGILFAIAFIAVMLGCGCVDGESYTATVVLMAVGLVSVVSGMIFMKKEKFND